MNTISLYREAVITSGKRCCKRYGEAVVLQSPGSRSAPWDRMDNNVYPKGQMPLRICSRPEQAAQDDLPYILNGFRRAVPAMRQGGFGNSCRNCAALVPAYLFSRMKMINGVMRWGRAADGRVNDHWSDASLIEPNPVADRRANLTMGEQNKTTRRACFCCRKCDLALDLFEREFEMWPGEPLRRYRVWICHHCSELPTIERIVILKLARISRLEMGSHPGR